MFNRGDGKRGQVQFAGTARMALRTNWTSPLFLLAIVLCGLGGPIAASAETPMPSETIELMPSEWEQLTALRRVAIVQAKRGDSEGARKTVWLMGNQNDEAQASALREIAVVQAKRGDSDGARKTVWLMGNQWSKIQAMALREIAVVQARRGHIEDARRSVWLIGTPREALRDQNHLVYPDPYSLLDSEP
jgi:hypothetical protein